MPIIRQVEIRNFRGISNLIWSPAPGLNCLIGPGDSCKSTVLNAIDLALSARRNVNFTDADFYGLNVDNPIEILITIGSLSDELLNLDRYGHVLRGFDINTGTLYEEPYSGIETVLTVKLTVRCDLQPEWNLYSERAAEEGIEKSIPWAQRDLIAPIKLDAGSDRHLAWGSRSLLNKLSDNNIDISDTLASVARKTRSVFDDQPIQEFEPVLTQVKGIAEKQGVQVGDLKALLDVNGVSLNNGAVSLHNSDRTPLRQLGTGSTRLLVSGIQRETSKSNIMLIDEAEYGLEPFRISKLLNNLGAKSVETENQVFITTHSPYVLRELQANQLWILRKILNQAPVGIPQPTALHSIIQASTVDGAQSTLRAEAESFFAKKILICEGKTEVGLGRGLDLCNMDLNLSTWLENGVSFADGAGGGTMFNRAEVFQSLGYQTAIFKDSDIPTEHEVHRLRMVSRGIPVFEWDYGYSTESAIFLNCPESILPMLLKVAVDRKGEQKVNDHIKNASNNLYDYQKCILAFTNEMRPVFAQASGKYKWFKDIEPMELIGRYIIGPYFKSFNPDFQKAIVPMTIWLES